LFIRNFGLTAVQFGQFGAIAIGLGGFIGAFGSGALCDWLRPRIPSIEGKLLMCALALSGTALWVIVLSHTLAIALLALFLFQIVAFAYLSPVVTSIHNRASPQTRGLALSVGVTIANVVNLGAGIPLVGVRERRASFDPRTHGSRVCIGRMCDGRGHCGRDLLRAIHKTLLRIYCGDMTARCLLAR
jgi:hypothetical protein